MTLDLAGIRKRAEAADNGPWEYCEAKEGKFRIPYVMGPSSNPTIPDPDIVATCRYSDRFTENDRANMKHIAGLDRPTVIALLDYIDDLRAALAPFAEVPVLPNGQVVGLERFWFRRAAALLEQPAPNEGRGS